MSNHSFEAQLTQIYAPPSILLPLHYNDVIMGAIASQITSLTIVYSTVYSSTDHRKQSSKSLAFVGGIYRWPVNSPHKWPVTWKIFPFDDVIMSCCWRDTRQIPLMSPWTIYKNNSIWTLFNPPCQETELIWLGLQRVSPIRHKHQTAKLKHIFTLQSKCNAKCDYYANNIRSLF